MQYFFEFAKFAITNMQLLYDFDVFAISFVFLMMCFIFYAYFIHNNKKKWDL